MKRDGVHRWIYGPEDLGEIQVPDDGESDSSGLILGSDFQTWIGFHDS